MPALLSSCRRAVDEARFDSGEQISCIIQDGRDGDATTPVAMEAILLEKVVFNLSSRFNNACVYDPYDLLRNKRQSAIRESAIR